MKSANSLDIKARCALLLAATALTTPAFAAEASAASALRNDVASGDYYMCNLVLDASDPAAQKLASLFGVAPKPGTHVGVTCSPYSGGNGPGIGTLTQCAGPDFSGLLVLDCTPAGTDAPTTQAARP